MPLGITRTRPGATPEATSVSRISADTAVTVRKRRYRRSSAVTIAFILSGESGRRNHRWQVAVIGTGASARTSPPYTVAL